MVAKHPMSFASRWMLPLEIWMAPVLLTAGLSAGGFLGKGRLFEAASAYGSPFWCFFFLSVIAFGALSVAFIELAFGRRWTNQKLFDVVSARCFFAFISISLWAYVSYLLWSTPAGGAASPFILIAPWCLLGNLLVFHQNFMVRCLLDPRLSTWALECKLMAERNGAVH